MLLWFVGLSLVGVWSVFRSPALDHRLVALGAVLPLAEVVAGRPLVLHTLAGAVAALAVVMAATSRRRLVRRRWLGLPIGLFLHLVLDGAWSDRRLFWWPFDGLAFVHRPLPELDRPVAVLVVQELVGLVALGWWWRRFGLADPARRRAFLRTGQVGRDLAEAREPSGRRGAPARPPPRRPPTAEDRPPPTPGHRRPPPAEDRPPGPAR